MYATTLTSKGQLTIPKPIRELLNWLQGEKLNVDVDLNAKKVEIQAQEKMPSLLSLAGSCSLPKEYQHLDAQELIKMAKDKAIVGRYLKTLPKRERLELTAKMDQKYAH